MGKRTETIANLSEYQEGLQRIWNTAEGVLGEEKYEHFYYLFSDFMMDKMRMKRVFPASGEGASAETEAQEKRKLYTLGNPKLYTHHFSGYRVRSFHLPPGGVRLGHGVSGGQGKP